MKTLKRLLFVSLISLAIFSCKKDKDQDVLVGQEKIDYDKSNVEVAGQQMITEMQAMKDAEAGNVLESFADCSSKDAPIESLSTKNTPVFRTIIAASTLSSGQNDLKYMSKAMKLDVEEDTSFSQIFNKHKATYTWNITNKVWDSIPSSDFKFIFPSKKGGTTNDATLIITYTGKTGLYPLDNYNGDLPATFNASIIVGGNTVFEVDFNASYNSDGIPSTVNYFIALYPFKYEISWVYNSSEISLRYHLTNGTKNIIDCFGGIGGNFSKSNIENKDNEIDDVLYTGNAYFQVFNIKLAGDIDFKKLYGATDSIKNLNMDEFKSDTALVKEINKYIRLNLIYADSKQEIATVEAYPIKRTETYYDYYSGQNIDEVYSDIDIKFVFTDGSKADLETYFNAGFGDLITDLNTFIVELNNDYELTIDPIDYEE